MKKGEGELVMQSRKKEHTGGTILNGGLTSVRLSGALGSGTTTVNRGATLSFVGVAQSVAYPIVVNAGAVLSNSVTVVGSSSLTLCAGATLKSSQNAYFDFSSGTVVLPAEGKVKVDMTGFSFAQGFPTLVLGGVEEGDESKFEAIVSEGTAG